MITKIIQVHNTMVFEKQFENKGMLYKKNRYHRYGVWAICYPTDVNLGNTFHILNVVS